MRDQTIRAGAVKTRRRLGSFGELQTAISMKHAVTTQKQSQWVTTDSALLFNEVGLLAGVHHRLP